MKKKLKLIKHETVYRVELDISQYDYLEVTQAQDGRITVKFLEQRWRTPIETILLLKEICSLLENINPTTL